MLAVLAFVWVPVALVLIFRKGRTAAGLSSFSFVLLASALVPLVLLYYVDQRQEYLFYELQVVPCLALGTAGLSVKRVPWGVVIVTAVAALIVFAFYFSMLRSVYNT